jgi:hypothetical protein
MTKPTPLYRFLELIPGALVWGTFILAFSLSFIRPLWVVYFVIAYYFLWLLRITYFIFYVFFSFYKYKKAGNTDWFAKIQKISDWEKLYHIIYLPTAGEDIDVLRTTFNSLSNATYPNKKMIVILGGEGRMQDDFLPKAEIIKKEFEDKFHKLLITVHPDGLENEMKGKGANANWMGHKSRELIDELQIPYENLVVSYFDSDTCAHPKYFAYLAYQYLTAKDPTRLSYQPAVNYNNNIWDAPAAMRVTAFGTVFWLMAELMRPDRMHTFSSHSMSFKALVDVNYWQKDIVTDDSRIFLQCFFKYSGKYSVQPMYIPVSMDTVMDQNYWTSFKNLYKQQRRWAWGVEHFPYMITNFIKDKKIPLYKKFKFAFNQIEGMYTWATAPILLFVIGRLPLFVVGLGEQSSSVIVQNAPFVLEWLMGFSMIGLFVSAFLSLLIIPRRPKKYAKGKYFVMLLQWILLPITFVLFGAFPAIDAQTRLMLGKKYHLGFFVTPKARK